jgi:hypothetical protein
VSANAIQPPMTRLSIPATVADGVVTLSGGPGYMNALFAMTASNPAATSLPGKSNEKCDITLFCKTCAIPQQLPFSSGDHNLFCI